MKRRIKLYLLAVTSLALAVFFAASLFWIRDRFESAARQALIQELSGVLYLAPAPEELEPGQLEQLAGELARSFGGGVRVTVTNSFGEVLADSEARPGDMANHMGREEFAQASAQGTGSAVRASETTGVQTMYVARQWGEEHLLRLSRPVAVTRDFVTGLLPGLLLLILLVFALATLFANRVTARIMAPYDKMFAAIEAALQRKDKQVELTVEYEEMEPVVAYFRTVLSQISEYIRQITAKTGEIENITSSMEEGLVMLDDKLEIVLINNQGAALLGIPRETWQKNITYLYRDEGFVAALLKTRDTGHRVVADIRTGEGRVLRFYMNPVPAGGYVLLISDVTELVALERMRTDFAANVSHELKTPLTSISGFAELIQTGLVTDAGQVREYAGKIHTESGRLVTLIDDIIRLSAIENGAQEQEEAVELRELADYTLEMLAGQVAERELTVRVEGTLTVNASRQRMTELLFNLLDNAVKYNRPGGSIRVELDRAQGSLLVENTGEDIPPEQQSRIFERFYRVDAARSRRTGGTGLGLSIAKHIVERCGGTIRVKSGGDRTCFTVQFPRERVKG